MRIMQCRTCGQTLRCADCGAEQTPRRPPKKTQSIRLTAQERAALKAAAEAAGVTVSEYVRGRLLRKMGGRED